MPTELWIHCGLWTTACLFGVFVAASEGRVWMALICALMAVLWVPSRIWAYNRWKKQREDENDNSGV